MISIVVKEFYETFKIKSATIAEFGESYFFDTIEIDGKGYAPIDVHKLLKMEDILLRNYIQVEYCFYDSNYYCSCTIPLCNGKADTKKEAFLEMMISIAENYLDNSDMDGEEGIYKQVQQLFSNKNNQEETIDVYECRIYPNHEKALAMCKYYPKGCKSCSEVVKVDVIKDETSESD